jgi:hypothetical protein
VVVSSALAATRPHVFLTFASRSARERAALPAPAVHLEPALTLASRERLEPAARLDPQARDPAAFFKCASAP